MFQRSGLCIRRSLPFGLILCVWLVLLAFAGCLWAQEATSENPTAGTIQGTVIDEDGSPVAGARVFYSSQATDTKGVTRAVKNGTYITETLPPGTYLVHVEGRDMLPAEANVTVTATASITSNFKLAHITPGPARLESRFPGNAGDNLPITGRNYLQAGELYPGVQAVDAAIYDPGKSGFQSLSIDGSKGRTTHFDIDEIEAMDETKGGPSVNLPTEGVRDAVISRATPELFQSLNAAGAVRVTTRSESADNWHGNLFGNFRDHFLGMAGAPAGDPGYSFQQYGFGAGGAVVKDKAFLLVTGERAKQDGYLGNQVGFPAPNLLLARDATFRENLLMARLDYNLSDNTKFFVRLGYDNADQLGPPNSWSIYRNQINVDTAAFGLDWNRGKYVHSARFGYQKLVNAINPELAASQIYTGAPFHVQLGSDSFGPSVAGPRQTIQRDLFARYDGSTTHEAFTYLHKLRFGGAVHRIAQGDYFAPGNYGPSVTSSNGLATIAAVSGDPSLPFSGGATNPLNYPVGTITIYNGLGNFSENSGFNRPTGGHNDTRLEGYFGDSFNVKPNINVNFGVNYVFDTGRTDSDLSPLLCSSINTNIVSSPPCAGNGYILDQFALTAPIGPYTQQSLGSSIARPYKNFSPQAGVAWDPGHNGRTVVRGSGGLFYDNFLLQNTYQDRINRLSAGQYNRSLTLCPTGAVLFPDSAAVGHPDVVSSVDGLDLATQICGQPIGSVATAIQDLQSAFQANQATVTGGPNVYSLANSVANFGGLLAPGFRTPRVIHISGGIERQMGLRSMFSVDYVRELGTQFPLGIDSNHVGDATFLTDGDNPNPANNTYAAELTAINNTLLANPASVGCPQALYAGASSQASVNCYLTSVPTATITDFARQGLDSSNAFCGPFPCSVLGKQQASFGGINPAVGSNVMYFPAGRSLYQGIHVTYRTSSGDNPFHRVQKIDFAVSYAWSRYRSNISAPDGSGGDYSILSVAEDYNRPHYAHMGVSGLDRTHQLVFTPTVEMPHGAKISIIAMFASPLPLSVNVPQMNGGGVAGEIFRSDVSGDGTVGDLLNGTFVGTTGRYAPSQFANAIKFYNHNQAGQLTPAGQVLAAAGLFSQLQLHALDAFAPLISSCTPPTPSCGLPGYAAEPMWLKTIDLRLNWPFSYGERLKIEPNVAIFNVFNIANFGGPGAQLSGILDGAPGTSLNNSTAPGVCGPNRGICTSRLDRVLPGTGTYSNGAPRQIQLGVRFTF